MKKNILLLLFTLLFVTSLYSQQAAIRIGYVDSQVILQQLPEAQKFQKELDNLLQKYQSEYDQMLKPTDVGVSLNHGSLKPKLKVL